MRLTKESEYALLGLAALATEPPGRSLSLAAVAEGQRLPREFLSKIFQKMVRHGLLVSGRGRGSGYALARSASRITVREVLEAVEGPRMLQQCLLWQEHCVDENPCPLHHRLKELHPVIVSMLESVTLADYVADSDHLQDHLS